MYRKGSGDGVFCLIVITAVFCASFLVAGAGCGGGGGGGGDAVPAECQDAVDNDSDGWIDADDPDCTAGNPESGFGLTQCNDGSDNDADGDIDNGDPDCSDALDDNETGGATIVGAAGGTVDSDDGYVSLIVPAGALSGDTTIEVVSLSTTPSGGIGTAYLFTPEGTSFDIPVTITVEYDELDIPDGLPESGVTLGTFVNGHQWMYMMEASVDTSANTVTGTTSSFSTYGLMIRPFESTLDGTRVVPSTASSATGKAVFSVDSDNNIMAYNISMSALEGTEVSAAIHGPAVAGNNASALHTLPSGSPKAGIWKYDEALEDELLAGEMYISVATSAYPSGEIRGQVEPSPASMSPADVTVRIHRFDDLSGSGPATGIPADVDDVVISVTALDMTSVAVTADLSSGNIVESISVPKGRARLFEGLAYSVSDTLLYRSYTYADVFDAASIVTLSMAGTTDDTPPVFSGLDTVQKISGDTVSLSWTPGTDDTAPSAELVYLVYASKSSGGQSFSSPGFVTDPGETLYNIGGLAMGSTYHFVVRAMDPAGNIDTNTTEVSASTYSSGTGLYVDVNAGVDGPSCGTSSDPCRTITYALTLTAGSEPIYVAKGVYDDTTGETFPLTLKTGTSLLGDLAFVQVFPTTSGNVHIGNLMPATLIRTAAATTTAAIVGGGDGYTGGIVVDTTPTKNHSITAIDMDANSLYMNRCAIYGAPDSTLYPTGVRTGAGSTIKRSLISGFKQRGVWTFGGPSTISHSVIRNNGQGVLVSGGRIYRNSITDNTFAILPGGSGNLIHSNTIKSNFQGIVNPGPGSRIESNWIVSNENVGLQIVSTDAGAEAVVVRGNHIRGNGTGVLMWSEGKAEINGNDLVCSGYVDFGTWGSLQIDVTNNRWDNDPPTLDDDAESNLVGCGDVDICWAATYAGTPAPVYLPTNGTEVCGSTAVAPIL